MTNDDQLPPWHFVWWETFNTFIEKIELSLLINYLYKTKILIDQ